MASRRRAPSAAANIVARPPPNPRAGERLDRVNHLMCVERAKAPDRAHRRDIDAGEIGTVGVADPQPDGPPSMSSSHSRATVAARPSIVTSLAGTTHSACATVTPSARASRSTRPRGDFARESR